MFIRRRFPTNVRLTLAVALGLLVIAAVDTAQAQQQFGFQYAVKFVCGKGDQRVVALGDYFTAINVHNPNETDVSFRKKFAIALPGEKPGPISKFYDARLKPDEAFEIDCPDIFQLTSSTVPFIKGFAVIETPQELDIVAVYTAAGRSGGVETMDVETFTPRRMGVVGKPDLIPVPDSSGNFCRFQGGLFLVTVRNQGTADAGPSVTKVDFSSGTVSQPTPPIPAGGSVDVLFVIPPGCFQPDCGFRITVDSTGIVDESNEANNTASGVCIG
jgi:CARDB protein